MSIFAKKKKGAPVLKPMLHVMAFSNDSTSCCLSLQKKGPCSQAYATCNDILKRFYFVLACVCLRKVLFRGSVLNEVFIQAFEVSLIGAVILRVRC